MNNENNTLYYLEKAPVSKAIVHMAVPMILSMVINRRILNISDLPFKGSLLLSQPINYMLLYIHKILTKVFILKIYDSDIRKILYENFIKRKWYFFIQYLHFYLYLWRFLAI